MVLLKISNIFKMLMENFLKFSVYFCITCIISIYLCECRSIRYFHHKEMQGHCQPNTYYDVRHEKCRSLPEGGEVAVIDYNKVCADKFLGPKPHPKRKEYFYLCKNDSVVLGKCSDSMIYNSHTKKCEQALVPCLDGSNNTSCSKPGRYPVKSNCSQFYICNRDGRQYYKKVLQCPGTKAFNPLTQRCSYKYKCTPTVAFSSYTPTENDDDDFPACKQPGRFRSPTNCALYYTCGLKRNGKFHQRRYRCPDGQLFDSSSKVCLDESEVKCEYTTPQNLTQLSNTQESIYYEDSLENNDASAEDSLFNVDKDFDVKNVEATTESGSKADEPYDSEYMHELSGSIDVNETNDTDLSVPLKVEEDPISANLDHMEDSFTSSLDTSSSNQVADSTVVESQNFNNINNALILNNVTVNNGNLNLSFDDANDNMTIVQTESTSKPYITDLSVATVTPEATTSSSIDSKDTITSASVTYAETGNTASSVIFDNSYQSTTSMDIFTNPTHYIEVSNNQQVSTEPSSLYLENSLSNNLTENAQVEDVSETETMAELMEVMKTILKNHENNIPTSDAILKLEEITRRRKELILQGKQPVNEIFQAEEGRQENLDEIHASQNNSSDELISKFDVIHASQDNSSDEVIQSFQDNALTESPGYVELNRTNVESETNQYSQNSYVVPGANNVELSQIQAKTGTETEAYSQNNSAPEGVTQLEFSTGNIMNETGRDYQDTNISDVTSAPGIPKNDYEPSNSVSQSGEPSATYGKDTSLGTHSDSQAVQNETHVSGTPQEEIDEASLKTQTESSIALGTVVSSDPHTPLTHSSIGTDSNVHQGVVASNISPELSEQNASMHVGILANNTADELIPYDDATNGSVTMSEQISATSDSEGCQKNLQPFQYGMMAAQNYNMDNKLQVICGPTNITDFHYPSTDVVLLNVFKPIRLIINFDPQGVPIQKLGGDMEQNSSAS